MGQQSVILRGGFGVAPEFSRTQHLALIVEQHQAVLLAGHANAEDRLAIDPGREQRAAGGRGEGFQPLMGVLFATAIGRADQAVAGGSLAEHFTTDCVEDDGLGALGAAVDAEEALLVWHSGSLDHSTWMSPVRPPSRASPLPQVMRRT
ncbi:hypothetical protein D3C86_1471230 [compost metagenome]